MNARHSITDFLALRRNWGQRRSLLLFNALTLAGYVLVLVWQHWLALVVGAFLFLAWSALSLPATFSVVASSLDKRQHTMGIGVQSMVRRVPMMVGPLIGSWLITRFGWEQGVLRLARLHPAQCGHGGLPAVHGGASNRGCEHHSEAERELPRRGEGVQSDAA